MVCTGQGFQVADAIVVCTGIEDIAEGERTKRRVAARAPTGNCQPASINKPLLDQVAGAIHAVIDVNDTPLALEPLAIGASIAGAAAIIHIENGYATAGPVLDLEFKLTIGHAC